MVLWPMIELMVTWQMAAYVLCETSAGAKTRTWVRAEDWMISFARDLRPRCRSLISDPGVEASVP